MPVQTEPVIKDADLDAAVAAAPTEATNSGHDEKAGEKTDSVPHGGESDAVDAPIGTTGPGLGWRRLLAYGVLPGLVMLLAMAAGLLKWWDSTLSQSQSARIESVQAAKDSTVAMLSYQPDTVEKDLTAAEDRMTGDFRGAYAQLTRDIVIPGAKEKRISAIANVPAAASVSATPNHAVVVVFVNQTAIVGNDTPTDTASSVRVTLDKVDGRWLISDFTPI